MDFSCKDCQKCYSMLFLNKKIGSDIVRKLITEYDDNHSIVYSIGSDTNEILLEHCLNILDIMDKKISSVNIGFRAYHKKRDHSFSSDILLKDKNNNVVFKLRLDQCDYDYYNPYYINKLLNDFIKKHNITIITDCFDYTPNQRYETSILNEEGLIEFPNYE